MKKKIIALVILGAIAVGAAVQFVVAREEDKIVAKIAGRDVYESEIREKVKAYMELNSLDGSMNYDKLDAAAKKEIISSVIVGDLILDEAKKAKIDETEKYKKTLAFAGNQLMQRIFLEKMIKENIAEAKIKEKYEQMIKNTSGKEEYKVSHILVKTEEEAKSIKAKLDKGADFAALVKEYSLDNNKEDGGKLGYFSEGQMVKPFEQATAALKVGEISGPVKTDFGYHIIKLEDKRAIKAPSFAELKGKISDELSAQFVQEYVGKLKDNNKVEFLLDKKE